MTAFYNELDPHAAQWLRNLSGSDLIAAGSVDERDIRDVAPTELARFHQCHFFAGIGVWSYALRKAGWPDDRSVWTGSCPCQPFSAAGARGGFADERHLWPHWFHLIEQRRPDTIFGEQVASKDGLAWLDLVRSDLEGAGYAFGVFDLCAAGFGAPHIRQRLFFVANAGSGGLRRRREHPDDARAPRALSAKIREQRLRADARADQPNGRMANPQSLGLLGRQDDGDDRRRERASRQGCEASELGDAELFPGRSEYVEEPWRRSNARAAHRSGARTTGKDGELVDAIGARLEGHGGHGDDRDQPGRDGADAARSVAEAGAACGPGPVNGFWRDADWIGCTDGKWRAVEPESFPLVDGAAFRVGSNGPFAEKSRAKMLRGYGNAIVAEVAAEFIGAYLEATA